MKRGSFKPEIAASVLLMAAYGSDQQACARYGVSIRSIQNWRKRLITDPRFAEAFATKQKVLQKEWANAFMEPLTKAASLISECYEAIRADESKKKDPEVLTAIADAARTCADILLTQQAINAQFSDPNQPPDRLPQEVPPTQVEYPC